MSKKLVLIDGHSILNRAFYGVPELTNAEGLHTNAIYGFLNILFKLLDEEKPDALAVAFDLKAPTFRHKMFAEYKGTRKGMPDELREQVPIMKQVLQAMGILIMEKEGFEADDILGTMAKRAEKEGYEVSLVSGDRDLLQIATDHIKIRIPKTKGGKTEIEDYYAKDVLERYQVSPLQFIDLKALMGDTADNIPGVPKVGEKTATGLMVTYGSLDQIYEHVEEITKKSIKESLIENKDLAYLSLKLATICIEADIPFSLEDAKMSSLFTKEAYDWCVKLNFKNMLSKFDATEVEEKEDTEYIKVVGNDETEHLFELCKTEQRIALYPLYENGNTKLISISFSKEKVYVVIISNALEELFFYQKLDSLLGQFDTQRQLLVFDVKKMYPYIQTDATEKFFDVKLGAYLINPNHKEYQIEDIASDYAGITFLDYKSLFGKAKIYDLLSEQSEKLIEYAGIRALSVFKSYQVIYDKVKELGMLSLYRNIDMPLTYILYDMEKEGIIVQGETLKEYSEQLGVKIGELEKKIYEQVGTQFNINSPKQLGEILFDRMGLKGGKKTKTGYSTAADVLEKLAVDYPVVADILEYRGLTKLKSTYADGLTEFIGADGRIHTSFNQMITATGRLSSTDPNLQNIPMRTEMGRMIRKVFVPKEGCVLVDADYSQIELRILAHFSNDPGLIEAYNSHVDIHSMTASKVFHVPVDEVTPLQRRNAKAVNFGIVYGISAFGLSQDINTTQKEASEYIKKYFETYPGVKQYQEDTVLKAKEDGYTKTMFSRIRPMPELASSNFMVRQFGERAAMNAPIQGTAADIIKIAMIQVYNGLKEAGLKSKMILQIHDELIIEAYEDELEQVKEIMAEKMIHAVSMAVPMEIDLNVGKNWYDAH